MAALGFIGDIHGEIVALQWALDTLHDVDEIVSLGDVVDGPFDGPCVALLKSRGVRVLQGNHDFWASRESGPGNARSPEERQWLESLPRTYRLDGVLAYHSRYDEDVRDTYWEYLNDERAIRKALAEAPDARVIFCGHTHVPAVNVLNADGTLTYVSTHRLREQPVLELRTDSRYVVNAGRPTMCAVRYEGTHVEFRFKQHAPANQKVRNWTDRVRVLVERFWRRR